MEADRMDHHRTSRRGFLRLVAGGTFLAAGASAGLSQARSKAERGGKKPNFLILIADDVTYSDIGCYGGQNVRTPNIDALAKQGMRFRYAYVAMSMCCPCRHELYTGLYPMRNGATWNHSWARPGTKSICHHLGELGYRVGLAGKRHVSPRGSYPFVNVPGFERGCCSLTARYDCKAMKRFMTSDPDQPFCLVVALVLAHSPWTVGEPGRFDLRKLKLPPTFADTPEVRQDYAKYLAEVAALDRQIGDLLEALDETGQADNTLVLFTSEQGAQWPGAKWTNWEQGLHTAFLVRWPGQVTPGKETDAIVQYADVVPTFLAAAGGRPAAKDLDGTSFLNVLRGKKTEHRRYAYGMHNNVPEGPPYPIRTVRTKEFRYIWNLTPEARYVENHMEQPKRWGNYWESWKKAAKTDPRAKRTFLRYRKRPAEELYKSNEDIHEVHNLAGEQQYASVKRELRAELERWMKAQGDPGAALDTHEALAANRKAGMASQKRESRRKKPAPPGR
jgi:N-sulfoglucosamine sulfohydrolase